MDLPIQPLYTDEHGTVRFRANALVRFLLDNGGIDMNKLAVEDPRHRPPSPIISIARARMDSIHGWYSWS
jgi:hypothetical protein